MSKKTTRRDLFRNAAALTAAGITASAVRRQQPSFRAGVALGAPSETTGKQSECHSAGLGHLPRR